MSLANLFRDGVKEDMNVVCNNVNVNRGDGTIANPQYDVSASGTGLYYDVAANKLGLCVNAQNVLEIDDATNEVIVKSPFEFVEEKAPPSGSFRLTSDQTISNSTNTLVVWDGLSFSNRLTFSAPSSSVAVQEDGVYQIHATIPWAANATGSRVVRILINGVNKAEVSAQPVSGAQPSVVSISYLEQMTASQAITLEVFQTSGGNLNISAGSPPPAVAYLTVHKV